MAASSFIERSLLCESSITFMRALTALKVGALSKKCTGVVLLRPLPKRESRQRLHSSLSKGDVACCSLDVFDALSLFWRSLGRALSDSRTPGHVRASFWAAVCLLLSVGSTATCVWLCWIWIIRAWCGSRYERNMRVIDWWNHEFIDSKLIRAWWYCRCDL